MLDLERKIRLRHASEVSLTIPDGAAGTVERPFAQRVPGAMLRALRTNPWVWIVAGSALLAVVVTNQLDLGSNGFRVSFLNANVENSWSHDVDTVLLAACLLIALFGAWHGKAKRRLWCATAVILALLFLDEASPFHTRFDEVAFAKALYTPILLALGICVWKLAARTDQRAAVAVGLATLLASFAMHVVGLHVLRPLGYLNEIYQAGVGTKEATELAGLVLVTAALWSLARKQASVGTRLSDLQGSGSDISYPEG